MKKVRYSKIEKLKYKRSKTKLIYLLFAIISLFVTNVNLFYGGFNDVKNANIVIFTILNSFLFMQVLFLPLLIAIITSKSVELEEQGNMLKVIISSGISLNKIYDIKLFHIMKSLTVYLSFLWLFIIAEINLLGFPCFKMPARLLAMFLSFILISYFITIIHYNIAIIKGSHLFNLALALLGSLLGFISLFFMKFPIIPYSWYSLISSVKYIRNVDGQFSLELIDLSLLPASISIILFTLLYFLGKKLFLRRQYD